MPQWTEDQIKAISSDRDKLICSAAAGSGKTAVMIERIVRLIREGADPFSFLVITFTNAAAAEMKEKIRKRLLSERKDARIAAAAEKAGAMEVCTIHAFCQHLIRQEFQIVGVDPFFQICTGAQRDRLFDEAFRQACDVLRQREDPDYLSFIHRYDPEGALEIVSSVWKFIMSLPDPFGWLTEKTESLPLDCEREHPWFRTISRMMREKNLTLRMILRRQAAMFDEYEAQDAYRPVWMQDRELVEALGRWSRGEDVPREELFRGYAKLPVLKNLNDREIDWKERWQGLRKQLKDVCGEMFTWVRADRERMRTEFSGIRDSLRGLVKITVETHHAFETNKARVRALDFTDLEHKALQILRDEAGRNAVRNRYQRIFVDECQDVSSVQNELISRLAEKDASLFMVGDVKQSIYRFRLANPKLFLSRIEDRGPDAGECIFLRENFRSRPEVLETANTIFRDVMHGDAAEVEYQPEDELRAGRTDCTGYEPVQVDLLEADGERTRLEVTADYLVERIRELTSGEEGQKKYRLSDIVILMPEVSTDGPKLAELLKKREIPIFFDGKGSFFDQPEVEVFRNLLMLLDNPHLDLPLLTALVNTPFGYTEEELSRIRLKNTGRGTPFWQAFDRATAEDSPLGRKCRETKNRIEGWRFLASRMPLPDLLWYLLEEAALYAVCGAAEHGRAAQKNLRSFCLQADRAAEHGACTLREFLDFLSEQASGGETQAAPALGEGDQMVRLMTMHKSKGLQFPVVFCLGLDKSLTGKPGGAVQLDEDLGVCLRYKVPEWRLSRKTAADEIFDWKREHNVKAEKICLLYVAVTRAQEKLFLVGTETDRALWHMPPGEHRRIGASDYLDLIMPALLDKEKESTTYTQGSKPWKIRILDSIQPNDVERAKVIHSLRSWAETLFLSQPVDGLWKNVQEKDTDREKAGSLKKYSVTALLQNARSRIFLEDEEQTPEEKRTPDYVERIMKRYQAGRRPEFLEPAKEAGGAARGTVIHRFLSLVDLDDVRKAGGAGPDLFREQLDRMTGEQVFTEEEAAWILPETVGRFFDSEIGRRMLASPEVHREWDFNLYVPERNMIIQGMIDCAFREGDGWILLDYKTDRITDEKAFTEEYCPQLAWYAAALLELTGKPVLESWLYALSVDKAYQVRFPSQA